ncbi:MAG: hypothetical protein A3E79_15740 [Burkholderiales bacterium RIFCSPHIGHO2_12_FULL_61_11]|nr:MAG: hypothetical protein A3E79_15740 [Burkholderiales bacterium RIFCSPHIGHO2_12_FULL_61_11]
MIASDWVMNAVRAEIQCRYRSRRIQGLVSSGQMLPITKADRHRLQCYCFEAGVGKDSERRRRAWIDVQFHFLVRTYGACLQRTL